MKVAGIVAEFNPLHNGHEYIISEARRLTGCESVCIAMSGNYVQRGEPAIADKWSRAEMALRAGADLVIEIPALFCLGNASQYANAGVKLLESIKQDISICCGSESNDNDGLRLLAQLIKDNKDAIEDRIREQIKEGLSYPAARESAVTELLKLQLNDSKLVDEVIQILNNPNDILALEYAMASKTSKLVLIERKGAGYSEDISESCEYQSAGGIRKLLSETSSDSGLEIIKDYVPDSTIDILSNKNLSLDNSMMEILRHAIMSKRAEVIDDCPSGGEGLGNLLKEAARSCDSWEDLIMHCKSKRYTYTRISRLCMQVLLDIYRKDYPFERPEYIRVLGFNDNGRNLLSLVKKDESSNLPIITNINKEAELLDEKALKMLELDVRATDVYNLVLGLDVVDNSDYKNRPIFI